MIDIHIGKIFSSNSLSVNVYYPGGPTVSYSSVLKVTYGRGGVFNGNLSDIFNKILGSPSLRYHSSTLNLTGGAYDLSQNKQTRRPKHRTNTAISTRKSIIPSAELRGTLSKEDLL